MVEASFSWWYQLDIHLSSHYLDGHMEVLARLTGELPSDIVQVWIFRSLFVAAGVCC